MSSHPTAEATCAPFYHWTCRKNIFHEKTSAAASCSWACSFSLWSLRYESLGAGGELPFKNQLVGILWHPVVQRGNGSSPVTFDPFGWTLGTLLGLMFADIDHWFFDHLFPIVLWLYLNGELWVAAAGYRGVWCGRHGMCYASVTGPMRAGVAVWWFSERVLVSPGCPWSPRCFVRPTLHRVTCTIYGRYNIRHKFSVTGMVYL